MQGEEESMRFSFNKKVLQDFNQSTRYEWLEFNEEGAYASSTIIGMNTRREHGLLNIYDSQKSHHISILSKLEESIFIDARLYELSTNQYEDVLFPHGYNYLESFSQDPFPTFSFLIEDRLLKKTLFLIRDKNILVVRYELKNQGNPIKLIIKPFLSVRNNHDLAKDIAGLNTDSYLGQSFVRFAPKNDMPELNALFNRGEFLPASLWYHKFKYPRDFERYSSGTEDLFNPGFFQVRLKPYETFDLYFSTENMDELDADFEALYRSELMYRLSGETATEFDANLRRLSLPRKNRLFLSFLQTDLSIRKVLLSMPVLLHLDQGPEKFKRLFLRILQKVDNGLLPLEIEGKKSKIPAFYADTPLWLFVLAYYYYESTSDKSFLTADVLDTLKGIIHAFIRGTSGNIYMDKTGLIFSGSKDVQTSMLPLKTPEGSILRYGYLPEVNALWYNALRIMAALYKIVGKQRTANKYEKNAKKTFKSFVSVFIDKDNNQLFDFVGHQQKGNTFRSLQIIPLSLPFPILEDELARQILSKIDERLVSPYGLKLSDQAISPDNTNLNEYKLFSNEAIWVWLVSFYVRACLRYKAGNPHLSADLIKYFQPLTGLKENGMLGFYPEAVRLNDSLQPLGAEDSFLSMANVSQAFHLLKNQPSSN